VQQVWVSWLTGMPAQSAPEYIYTTHTPTFRNSIYQVLPRQYSARYIWTSFGKDLRAVLVTRNNYQYNVSNANMTKLINMTKYFLTMIPVDIMPELVPARYCKERKWSAHWQIYWTHHWRLPYMWPWKWICQHQSETILATRKIEHLDEDKNKSKLHKLKLINTTQSLIHGWSC
jgi:hypothetical protein